MEETIKQPEAQSSKTEMTKTEMNNLMVRDHFSQHKPYIVLDVEATGIMNGNDNHITEIAFSAYAYNSQNRKYELQDHIFMLAKPVREAVEGIQAMQHDPMKGAVPHLKKEFLFEVKTFFKNRIEKHEAERDAFQKQIDSGNLSEEETAELTKKIAKKDKTIQKNKTHEYFQKFGGLDKDHFEEAVFSSKECNDYIQQNLQKKADEIASQIKIEEMLMTQGIDINKWMRSGEGLSFTEMQTGITAFFQKNFTKDTMVATNGTYYSKHYMNKDGLFLPVEAKLIDVPELLKGSDYTCNFAQFARRYEEKTGKRVMSFDALTKTLCMSELLCLSNGFAVSHNSVNHLKNAVVESAFDPNNEASVDAATFSMTFYPEKEPRLVDPTYVFDSLEYVDFGNERKYVDIDSMFALNDNFEITLEGSKEPIKSWEELETKIKSLNADISDELLNRIKDKYFEMEKEAEYARTHPQRQTPSVQRNELQEDGSDFAAFAKQFKGNVSEEKEITVEAPKATISQPIMTLEEIIQQKKRECNSLIEIVKEEMGKARYGFDMALAQVRNKMERELPQIAEYILYLGAQFGKCGNSVEITVDNNFTCKTQVHQKPEGFPLIRFYVKDKVNTVAIDFFVQSGFSYSAAPDWAKSAINILAENYTTVIRDDLIEGSFARFKDYLQRREGYAKELVEKTQKMMNSPSLRTERE